VSSTAKHVALAHLEAMLGGRRGQPVADQAPKVQQSSHLGHDPDIEVGPYDAPLGDERVYSIWIRHCTQDNSTSRSSTP
jgi:hypothetical protein